MPATSPLWPIQQAVFTVIISDMVLTDDLGVTVADGPPEGTLLPYIDLGEAIETSRNELDQFGAEVLLTLHVWSQQDGYREALQIADRLRVLLDHQPLTVTGHAAVLVKHERTLTLRDPNPELRHVPVTFRAITEQE